MTRGPNLGGLPKRAIALRMWRDHTEHVDKLRRVVFDMMAHPDATDEQLAYVRQLCINTAERTRDLRNKLKEKGLI